MKKSVNFLILFTLFTLLIMCLTSGKNSLSAQVKQEYLELRVYHIAWGSGQEGKVDAFLKDVYLPALHRAGIAKVGVFKPIETDVLAGKRIFVLIPVKTVEQSVTLSEVLSKDKVYVEAGKSFIEAPYNEPPYARLEKIMLKAFKNMPQPFFPSYTNPVPERVYELRSYESATEAKANKKIAMFNEGGEIDIFTSLKFNAVFYGEVISGSAMPNLMYMTTFTDMKSHDEHWKAFGATPEWKKLSAMEEYKNTVSQIDRYLLRPTDYSDY
jgi:hypothetical protein